MSERILVVCAANVCRSPLAAILLRNGLGDVRGLRIESAGMRARKGDQICELVAALHPQKQWSDAAAAHRARTATTKMLEGSALILTASKELRADVVRMAPALRDRVYTLREAALLGQGFDAAEQVADVSLVGRYTAHLGRRRTVVRPPAPRASWRPFARATDPLSIEDRHGADRRRHQAALREVEEAASAVVAQLSAAEA